MATKKDSSAKKSTTSKKTTSKKATAKNAKKTSKAKSKKPAAKKKPEVDEIPPDLAAEIQEAAAVENQPSRVIDPSKLKITNWEELDKEEEPASSTDSHEVIVDTQKTMITKSNEPVTIDQPKVIDEELKPKKTAISVTVVDDEPEAVEPEEETEVKESETEPNEVAIAVSSIPIVDASESEIDQELDEADEELDEDHEWHKLDDEADLGAAAATVNLDDEEADTPEWDEEKWKQANIDEEEPESLEWDEEKWQQANDETDEEEGPEWDEEKWQAAEAEKVVDTEQDADISEKDANFADMATGKSEGDSEDDDNPDHMSASQYALNNDVESKQRSKFDPRGWFAAIASWWGRSKVRNSAIIGFALLLLIVVVVPVPRYAALNTFGVRAAAAVKVMDEETMLPLRSVSVQLAGQTVETNELGIATFNGIRLGGQTLEINKSAYQTITQKVTVGLGSNNYEDIALVATGSSFEFRLIDWLSGEPLTNGEVVYGDNSAYVNSDGVATLRTPPLSSTEFTVEASADEYARQEVTISTTETGTTDVDMVVERNHLFITKREGTYDVYRISADGATEELLLKGTGSEKDALRFDISPSGRKAVLVATRDPNIRNIDNFVLSGLYTINPLSGEIEKIDSSERIDIVGWIGDRVIYVKVQAGASGQNPERHRLMSYDTLSGDSNQIAASNYFNDVLVAKDYVFYAPSDAYKKEAKPYLFRSNADGTAIETVFEKTVWTVIRSGLEEISFDSNQVWYKGNIDTIFNQELSARPTNVISKLYSESPDGSHAAWVDQRDGKGTLILTNTQSGEETVVAAEGGLRHPLVWLSNKHLVYRVVTSDQTADYVINIQGGESRKIRDVTNVSGADRWYYYY